MSRCRACNKRLSSAELAIEGENPGIPEDLCSQCRAVVYNPDEADQLEQNLVYVNWDELDWYDNE